MTRFTNKEKVALDRAKMPVATTRTDSSALAGQGNVLERWLRRAAVVRELSQLDDRMLADIGVQRWQIETVADKATGATRGSLLSALAWTLAAPFARWYRRNEAYRQLASLDAGVGTCGKDGQAVPVGVGQPTIRIDSLTVGGTQA